MAGKNTAAFGIFNSRSAAETAVDRLTAAGFSHQDVSVLMSDQGGSKDFAAEKNTKAPEGTATGVTLGGLTGGTLGLLAGLGALAIPGVGPLIAAGPIMGALAGLGVGGAVGGLVGALIGMGIPEYEAKRYEGRVKDGGILVSVHCESSEEVSRAKAILREAGGEDVASSGEKGVSTHTANTDAVVDRARGEYDRTTSGYDRTNEYARTGTTTGVGDMYGSGTRTVGDTYATGTRNVGDTYASGTRSVDDTYATGTGRTRLEDEAGSDVLVNDRKPIISTPE